MYGRLIPAGNIGEPFLIKYIGSKRTLVPHIVRLMREMGTCRRVLDLFSGTTRVAQGLKEAAFEVTANDTATYSEVLARTYIEQDASRVDRAAMTAHLDHLNSLPGVAGYFTETFCERSRYFQPKNGMRIDAIRPEIDRLTDDIHVRATLLTSLMEAADRVDSTTGLQMAYLKTWAPRSFNDLELRMPRLLRGPGHAARMDANSFVRQAAPFDVTYVDPPYNQHSYFSNYHIWETLIRNDAPEVYGIACKRVDCRTNKSDFNSKRKAFETFDDVLRNLRSTYVVVSFNNEGYFRAEEVMGMMRGRWPEIACLEFDFKRYVGAQIGIYNPDGEKVGAVSHLRNKEFLFFGGPDALHIAEKLAHMAHNDQITLV